MNQSASSTFSGGNGPARELVIERVLEAEQMSENKGGENAIPYLRVGPNSMVPHEYKGAVSHICQMVNKQIYQLIDFARRLPHFLTLNREDQVCLVRCGWNELVIVWIKFIFFKSLCNLSSSSFS